MANTRAIAAFITAPPVIDRYAARDLLDKTRPPAAQSRRNAKLRELVHAGFFYAQAFPLNANGQARPIPPNNMTTSCTCRLIAQPPA